MATLVALIFLRFPIYLDASMLNFLRKVMNAEPPKPEPEEQFDDSVDVTVAMLLMEVARANFEIDPAQRTAIERALAQQFSLSEAEAHEMTEHVNEAVDHSTGVWPFIRVINAQFDAAQRFQVVELLWAVALADNHKHELEEAAAIRRIADLLYVSHSDFIRAKLIAERTARNN